MFDSKTFAPKLLQRPISFTSYCRSMNLTSDDRVPCSNLKGFQWSYSYTGWLEITYENVFWGRPVSRRLGANVLEYSVSECPCLSRTVRYRVDVILLPDVLPPRLSSRLQRPQRVLLCELAPTAYHEHKKHDNEQSDDEEPYDEPQDEVWVEQPGATLGAVELTRSRCDGCNEKHVCDVIGR